MKLTRRAALDGVQLDEIDSRILIQGIEPAAGKDQLTTVSLWGGVGSRVTGEHRDSLDIAVKFSLDIKKGQYQERSEIFEKVMAWAEKGGWLTVSQKPDRRIRVFCAQKPAEGDPLEWTNRYSITFRACGVPYWQQETASQPAADRGGEQLHAVLRRGRNAGNRDGSHVQKHQRRDGEPVRPDLRREPYLSAEPCAGEWRDPAH